MRSAPNSTRRAATCAGPTRAAAIAAVVLAPAISRRRGRWAAMAPVTNQVAAKTNAAVADVDPLDRHAERHDPVQAIDRHREIRSLIAWAISRSSQALPTRVCNSAKMAATKMTSTPSAMLSQRRNFRMLWHQKAWPRLI